MHFYGREFLFLFFKELCYTKHEDEIIGKNSFYRQQARVVFMSAKEQNERNIKNDRVKVVLDRRSFFFFAFNRRTL